MILVESCSSAFVYLCPHFPNECGSEGGPQTQGVLHLPQFVKLTQTYLTKISKINKKTCRNRFYGVA